MFDFLLFIFCILQVVLFFKIWGMTNSVKEIERKISIMLKWKAESKNEITDDFMFYIYNEHFQEAKACLQKSMWNHNEMQNLIKAKSIEEFNKSYNTLKHDYTYWYQLIDEKFPTFDHMRKRIMDTE